MGKSGASIRFYGVRGSIPVPGPTTVRTGGNTSCVLYTAGDQNIILDCGSGMRVLAGDMMAAGKAVKASVLISHYHWDHLIGLPFFYPIYNPKTELTFYGESKVDANIHGEVSKQFTGPNFPVQRKDLRSKLSFVDISPDDHFTIADVDVQVCELNHPNRCVGFKLSYKDSVIVYTTDHEHGTELDDKLIDFARGADCLIFDQMYTLEEYETRTKGFGHSCWQKGTQMATEAGVRDLFLFHHDPNRDDDAVEQIEAEANSAFRGAVAAREGFSYDY